MKRGKSKSILGRRNYQSSDSLNRQTKVNLEEHQVQERIDPYAGYLSDSDLCEKANLNPSDLANLENARILLPDHDGKYRPKLEGWAHKLAFLLANGWEISEIKAWSKGRWATPDPRLWPPIRNDWRE